MGTKCETPADHPVYCLPFTVHCCPADRDRIYRDRRVQRVVPHQVAVCQRVDLLQLPRDADLVCGWYLDVKRCGRLVLSRGWGGEPERHLARPVVRGDSALALRVLTRDEAALRVPPVAHPRADGVAGLLLMRYVDFSRRPGV